ncbi:MAG TPA: hypothetical protein PLN21_16195 [Gemmatales bacterium]|nr:hypothetical protein [Gemmatales bacterium]
MPSIWNALSTPMSGELLAVRSGSPAETVTLNGIIRRAEVIETFGDDSIIASGSPRFGDPLISDGVTIWVEGHFPSGTDGLPVSQDRADILAAWDTLRAGLQSSSYHFFLYYHPGDDPLYRKYISVHPVLLRSQWVDPIGILYQLAAISSDRTLSTAAPEEAEEI